MKKILVFLFLTVIALGFSQPVQEVNPPFNIKTISFIQNGQNVIPIFYLGDSFQFQFDDLYGNEANYYFKLTHCNYDWTPSQLFKNEYIDGFDEQRIQDYTNSVNCLQIYSHYRLSFPNKFTTRIKVSGNYLLTILNDDKEVVFSRKFIVYENMVNVPVQIKRARNLDVINTMQDLYFSITSNSIMFQMPQQNVKVMLIQNAKINQPITNIKPMYTVGNDLIYRYDTETQFWGSNEYLYFDTRTIRGANSTVSYVDLNGGLYGSHLYANEARASKPYTYWPDLNGNFVVNNINSDNSETEADYGWVYFTLSAPAYYGKSDVYIAGMFNNYALTPENKMDYNAKTGQYEKAIMVKQGITNYEYILADKNGVIDNKNAIDGNFWQTENNYQILVYYKENNQRYDRIIGRGTASSTDITN